MAGASGYPAATHLRGRVARYRIVEKLGEGGMGIVHLAFDETLGRKVALKLLSPRLADDVQFRERFMRESRLAAAIDHPNIIPVYEAGEAEGRLFIAMRYVCGRDARELLAAEGSLEPQRAVAIVDQVARALDAAHRAGLVHRDVKPANVMVDASEGAEHCYLMDFGLTKNASSSSGYTQTGQFVGTLSYMAPEQIEGRPVDGRADLYALGCMLFECLAGCVPFRRDSDIATMYAHLHEPPPSLCAARPELPAEVDTVVARALAKAPGDRHASCAALIAEMRTALAGARVPAFRPSSARTGKRFSRQPGVAVTTPAPPVAPLPRSAPPSRPPTPRGPQPAPAARRAQTPPPRLSIPPGDANERSYLRAAAIVGAAIMVCAGGIAAALVLRHGGGDSSAVPSQAAQQRLLNRTVELDRELVTLSKRIQAKRAAANAATKRRIKAAQARAQMLIAQARATQAGADSATRSLVAANQKLLRAANGLLTFTTNSNPAILVHVVSTIGHATNDVNTASSQIEPVSGGAGALMPTVSMASLPTGHVQLPGDQLARIDAGPGRVITAVSDVGDVDGDGTADFGLVATPSDGAGEVTGYVVFGRSADDVQLEHLGDRGVTIPGATSLTRLGDVDGDGQDDLGVLAAVGNAPAAFVVPGKGLTGKVDLATLSGGREIDLPTTGEAPDGPGDGIATTAIRAAGDVNGDGTNDVIVGDPLSDGASGRAWVIFGGDKTSPVSLDALDSADGFSISGDPGAALGGSVSSAHDVNGDGVDDVIVGSAYHGTGSGGQGAGAAYVIYGSKSPGDVDVSKLGAKAGFTITSDEGSARLGSVVVGLGDVNGDQAADVLVTAPSSSPQGRAGAGAAFVVFGPADGRGGDLNVDHLGARGFAIDGPTPVKGANLQTPSGLGSSAAFAGDMDGDGTPDWVIGSPGPSSGAIAYVVYGSGDTATVDLAKPGGRALAIDGDRGDFPNPLLLAGGADFDADGNSDVVVAPNSSQGATSAYVVAGG